MFCKYIIFVEYLLLNKLMVEEYEKNIQINYLGLYLFHKFFMIHNCTENQAL